jgi:hypothetical protein
MSILDRVFGRKKLTADWIADPGVPLRVDLDSCRFCKVALGSSIEELTHLGPSSSSKAQGREHILVYGELGFQLFLDEHQHLDTVDINLLAEEGMAAFVGCWHFAGEAIAIDVNSTPADIQAILGPPNGPTDNEGVVYARTGGNIEFSWGDGRLENVMLFRPFG